MKKISVMNLFNKLFVCSIFLFIFVFQNTTSELYANEIRYKKITESAAKLGSKTGEIIQDFVKVSKQILGNEIGAIGKIDGLTDSLKAGKGVLSRSGTLIEREVLNPEQIKNLSRFEKKLPVGAKPTEIRDLGEKGKVFSSEVPGQAPGSKAVYEKHIDSSGNTVNYYKTTYDPKGEIVHIKDKINGGIVEIGDLE